MKKLIILLSLIASTILFPSGALATKKRKLTEDVKIFSKLPHEVVALITTFAGGDISLSIAFELLKQHKKVLEQQKQHKPPKV